MYKVKMGLGTSSQFGIPLEEQILLFKKIGFEGFFVNWDKNVDIKGLKEFADINNMIFQSVHAPFEKSADMWENGEKAEIALSELLSCLHDCSENNIPIMVCHAIIGFDKHSPSDEGIKNFSKLVDEANNAGVKIAFENTEGDEYLKAIMDAFANYPNVGFCWDTGHEMCYNRSEDMLRLYGDKLICTHLNDNVGIKDYSGNIFWTDDLHLLPFDGVADWNDIVRRLNKYNYEDMLTFELNKISKPERYENMKYEKMTIEEYISEAYVRACRVATLKLNEKIRLK